MVLQQNAEYFNNKCLFLQQQKVILQTENLFQHKVVMLIFLPLQKQRYLCHNTSTLLKRLGNFI